LNAAAQKKKEMSHHNLLLSVIIYSRKCGIGIQGLKKRAGSGFLASRERGQGASPI